MATTVVQSHGGALNAGGTVGNRGGHGIKEVMRELCRSLVLARKGFEYVADVMDGTVGEKVVITVGSGADARQEVVVIPTKHRDRLYAFELLRDAGWGKPEQGVTIEDERPRRTGEEIEARIMELLPRVIAVLPVERKEIARLFAQRQRVELLVQGRKVS